MYTYWNQQKGHGVFNGLIYLLAFFFFSMSLGFPAPGYGSSVLNLPEPGRMVSSSERYTPAILRGLTLHPDNPFQIDFFVDRGDDKLTGAALETESGKLIKYFLSALTVPEEEMWVNLSPYESERIIPENFGRTEMGRDLLAQDYVLKQLSASLLYPEDDLGSAFWQRVYAKAKERFGTSDIPVDAFNKVWIVPENASVYVNGRNVFVVDNRLKVMLEKDYLASYHNNSETDAWSRAQNHARGTSSRSEDVSSEILKEIIIPEIEREVNEGKHFANLRQIYNSIILAKWYKQNIQNNILDTVFVDKKKIAGLSVRDRKIFDEIYRQYIDAFKKGVFNYIKEDIDPQAQSIVPRHYVSGGAFLNPELKESSSRAMLSRKAWVVSAATVMTTVAVVLTCTGSGCTYIQPRDMPDAVSPVDITDERVRTAMYTVRYADLLKAFILLRDDELAAKTAIKMQAAAENVSLDLVELTGQLMELKGDDSTRGRSLFKKILYVINDRFLKSVGLRIVAQNSGREPYRLAGVDREILAEEGEPERLTVEFESVPPDLKAVPWAEALINNDVEITVPLPNFESMITSLDMTTGIKTFRTSAGKIIVSEFSFKQGDTTYPLKFVYSEFVYDEARGVSEMPFTIHAKGDSYVDEEQSIHGKIVIENLTSGIAAVKYLGFLDRLFPLAIYNRTGFPYSADELRELRKAVEEPGGNEEAPKNLVQYLQDKRRSQRLQSVNDALIIVKERLALLEKMLESGKIEAFPEAIESIQRIVDKLFDKHPRLIALFRASRELEKLVASLEDVFMNAASVKDGIQDPAIQQITENSFRHTVSEVSKLLYWLTTEKFKLEPVTKKDAENKDKAMLGENRREVGSKWLERYVRYFNRDDDDASPFETTNRVWREWEHMLQKDLDIERPLSTEPLPDDLPQSHEERQWLVEQLNIQWTKRGFDKVSGSLLVKLQALGLVVDKDLEKGTYNRRELLGFARTLGTEQEHGLALSYRIVRLVTHLRQLGIHRELNHDEFYDNDYLVELAQEFIPLLASWEENPPDFWTQPFASEEGFESSTQNQVQYRDFMLWALRILLDPTIHNTDYQATTEKYRVVTREGAQSRWGGDAQKAMNFYAGKILGPHPGTASQQKIQQGLIGEVFAMKESHWAQRNLRDPDTFHLGYGAELPIIVKEFNRGVRFQQPGPFQVAESFVGLAIIDDLLFDSELAAKEFWNAGNLERRGSPIYHTFQARKDGRILFNESYSRDILDEVFVTKAMLTENPFPHLMAGSEVSLTPLLKFMFSKTGFRQMMQGGPLRQPAFAFAIERDRDRLEEVKAVDEERFRDRSYDRYFTEQSRIRSFDEIVDAIQSGEISLPVIYKPNHGAWARGIFKWGKDASSGDYVLTVTYSQSREFETLSQKLIYYFSGVDGVSPEIDEARDVMKIQFSPQRPDAKEILMEMWKMMSDRGYELRPTYDSGMIEELIPVFTYKTQSDPQGLAYETRHDFEANLIDEDSFDPDLNDKRGKWETYARLGSSEEFSNTTGRETRAYILDHRSMYNPLFRSFNIPEEKQDDFRQYVDGMLREQFRYLVQRLRAAGIAFDIRVKGAFDLMWTNEVNEKGFPVPVLIESSIIKWASDPELSTTVMKDLGRKKKAEELFDEVAIGDPVIIQHKVRHTVVREDKVRNVSPYGLAVLEFEDSSRIAMAKIIKVTASIDGNRVTQEFETGSQESVKRFLETADLTVPITYEIDEKHFDLINERATALETPNDANGRTFRYRSESGEDEDLAMEDLEGGGIRIFAVNQAMLAGIGFSDELVTVSSFEFFEPIVSFSQDLYDKDAHIFYDKPLADGTDLVVWSQLTAKKYNVGARVDGLLIPFLQIEAHGETVFAIERFVSPEIFTWFVQVLIQNNDSQKLGEFLKKRFKTGDYQLQPILDSDYIEEIKELISAGEKATVKMQYDAGDGSFKDSGSGFLTVVDGERYLVTAKHLSDDNSYTFRAVTSTQDVIPLEFVGYAPDSDVAVYRLGNDAPEGLTTIPVSKQAYKGPGGPSVRFGYNLRSKIREERDKVSNVWGWMYIMQSVVDKLHIDTPNANGMSGGPVFDLETREVVAVSSITSSSDADVAGVEVSAVMSVVNDAAMLATEKRDNLGGIDMNLNNIDLDVQGESSDYQWQNLDPEVLQNLDINGFIPTIIHITPTTNMPFLLGFKEPVPGEEPYYLSAR